ncbi:MAG: Trk system potassium transporter TrkA [Pseudomonadota bacterium]
MRIVIVGAGVVGYSLAEQLSHELHDISLVEQDSSTCNTISEKMDLRVVQGTASSPDILKQAGIDSADMVIAVTPNDEINILVCGLAEQYGVKKRIARIRNQEYSDPGSEVDVSRLGVTQVIQPERVVVDAILQFIESPGALDAANFQNSNILLRGYEVLPGMPVAGQSLKEISSMAGPHLLLVVTIVRQGKAIIPTGDLIVEPGDQVFALFPRESLDTFLSLVNRSRKSVKRVVIAGNGLTSVYLASALEKMIDGTVYVASDYKEGERLAEMFHNVEVLYGDCMEVDTLQEVHVGKADFFVATGKTTENNIMSALLAKAEGAKEVISISIDPRYNKLFHSIGIDHVISPRLTMAREIMEVVRRGQIGAATRIRDVDIEIIRIIAGKKSRVVGRPLQDVWKNVKVESLVGGIIRNDTMIIPDGNTVIEPGDDVIVITHTKNKNVIQKLFVAK